MADGELEDIAIIGDSEEDGDVVIAHAMAEKGETKDKNGTSSSHLTPANDGDDEPEQKGKSASGDHDILDTAEDSLYDQNLDDLESPVSEDIAVRENHASSTESSEGPSLRGQKFVLSGVGVEVYVTDSPENASKLVILLTNSLGLASINNLRLADTYAENLKCPVIVPDLFDKDPIRATTSDVPELTEAEFNSSGFSLSKVKAIAVTAVKGFMDEMWVAKHTFDRTYPQLCSAISEIVQVYSPQVLGVIGYSFGGRYVLRLLEDQRNNAWSSDEDLVTVGAAVHPSLIDDEDFKHVHKPLAFVYSARDSIVSQSLVDRNVKRLKERGVDLSVHVFDSDGDDSLPHGFAVPGDYSSDVVGTRPQQVTELVSNFFKTRL
jgi:dienelactone hydrolase